MRLPGNVSQLVRLPARSFSTRAPPPLLLYDDLWFTPKCFPTRRPIFSFRWTREISDIYILWLCNCFVILSFSNFWITFRKYQLPVFSNYNFVLPSNISLLIAGTLAFCFSTEEFLQLPREDLLDIVARDELNISSEEQVSIWQWGYPDPLHYIWWKYTRNLI